MGELSITITPTPEVVLWGAVPARVWEGVASDGARCRVLVCLVQVPADQDTAGFDRALLDVTPVPPFVPDPEVN